MRTAILTLFSSWSIALCLAQSCRENPAECAASSHGKAHCRKQGEDYEALCYIPNLCRDKRRDVWEIPHSVVQDLNEEGTAEILQNIWWYGEATLLSAEEEPSQGIPAYFVNGTTFFSTVQFGASIYARYTGFPLLSLLESQAQGKLPFLFRLPPISTVLHVLFARDQHRKEPWVRELVALLQERYGLNVVNSYSALFDSNLPRVCVNALLYSHKNTGVLGERLRWFPGEWAAEHLKSMVYPNLPEFSRLPDTKLTAVILQRKQNLQGKPAMRVFQERDVYRIETLLANMGMDVEVLHFENTTFWEQARIMRAADVLVTPHGNGLINTVFMRRCAVVLEIFPFNFASPVFGDLAKQTGLVYKEIFNLSPEGEGEIPSCLTNNSTWLAASRQECTRMLHTCLPCARNSPRVHPDITQLTQLLGEALEERNLCLRSRTSSLD